ncbi:MAG TPA: AMP-binding protein [Ktedonobacteraceae bacterium]|nr:AMP-binding protein [Ktedonobacteraceae bacterium]
MKQPYWNEDIETMPREKLRRLENSYLQTQLDYVWSSSPFYQAKFAEAGVQREAMRDLADLPLLPFTEKDECRSNQQEHPPFGDYLACGQEPVIRVHKTSGTTGRALYVALTRNDRNLMNECAARSYWASGLRPSDTVVHCLNYRLWVGGYSDHEGLETTGATTVPFGVGQTSLLIQTIRELQINAISATPSYMLPLSEAMRELGLHPRDLGLRKGFFGAEPGMSEPSVRAKMEETWGMRAMDANFGMADILSIMGSECEERQGLHFHAHGAVAVELIEPDTGTPLPLTEGAEGELVYTHLIKEAQPLIRYRARDVVRILGTEPCACGRTSFRFRILGRSDDMLVVRGINVFPTGVGNTLARLSDRLSGEFQIVVDHPPPHQYLRVRVELAQHVNSEQVGDLPIQIIQALREHLNFRSEPEFVPYGTLPRTEQKARRVIKAYEQSGS